MNFVLELVLVSGISWDAFVWTLQQNGQALFNLVSCTEISDAFRIRRGKVTEM